MQNRRDSSGCIPLVRWFHGPFYLRSRCSAPEQKMNIPEGQLKKEVKSQEQKEKDIAEVSTRLERAHEELYIVCSSNL